MLYVNRLTFGQSHAPADVPKALARTLSDLGVEYLDLYLMHWPVAKTDGKSVLDFVDVSRQQQDPSVE